jgi:hydrogenase nickel incorporation protein HypA/HybF
MHEMSIVQSLFEIIGEEVRKNDLARVTLVRMRVGEMSGLVPDSIEFCFEVLARETPVEGAKLEITVVPITGHCASCGCEFPVRDLNFTCPGCGGLDVDTVGGEELCLDELEGE